MSKQEELEEKLKENFIKDYHFEDLNEEEKEMILKIAFKSITTSNIYFKGRMGDDAIRYLLASQNIQNFHILKTLKENNDKLDSLIQQNIETNKKLDILIELLSKYKV